MSTYSATPDPIVRQAYARAGLMVFGPCIESTRTPGRKYPMMSVKGKTKLESRVVWEEVHGPISKGAFICHRCDNTRCIRVDHLFMGDPITNVLDAIDKDRPGAWRRRESGKKLGPWKMARS